MLVNSTVFVRAKNCQVCADLERDIRDDVARRTGLHQTYHRWIFQEIIRRQVHELIAGPLAHLVYSVSEMALSERPVDRVARLDDVEHVDGRVGMETEEIQEVLAREGQKFGIDGSADGRGAGAAVQERNLAEEMARGWRAGERPVVEDFLARYPELHQQPGAAVELIYEELCLREEYGAVDDVSGVLDRTAFRDQVGLAIDAATRRG